MGGSILVSTTEEYGKTIVPGINLRFNNNYDPAIPLFTTANFPGASSAQLTDARALYALLTGRVNEVTGQATLDPNTNKYTAFGTRTREGKLGVYSAFLQDSWKITPELTVTGGLRWDVQTPFSAGNSTMSAATLASVCGVSGLGDGGMYSKCNFLQPGATGGAVPEFIQFKEGTEGYKTDWNNVAPSVSVAWRPNVQDGLLRTFLGDPDQATLRAGWSVAYERQGMGIFTGVYGVNPGSSLSLSRNENTGLVPPGETWPVLLSQKNRLYTQPFPESPTYPIPVRANRADDMYAFAPDVQIGRAQTWNIGLQRAITKDMAVEFRYVGTKGSNQWSQLDWNAIRGENLVANNFMNEFKLAMSNLAANNAAGGSRAGSFAYFGAGTGTNPLPIYLAYLNGRTDFTNPAAYTGGSSTWTSTTFASRLAAGYARPVDAATDLDGNATRRSNAAKAGLPANFFRVNPDIDNLWVYDSGAFSDYHALQIDLRRRLSRGLSASVNYQYAIEGGSSFDGFSFGRVMSTSGNIRHAIKGQWDWTIPVGRGERYGSNMGGFANGLAGGWSFNGVARVQQRAVDLGNVRLVGMTHDELQDMFKYYQITNPTSGLTEVWMLPEDVRLNTRRAYSTSTTTPDGYSTSLGAPTGRYIAPPNSSSCVQVRAGDCAPRNTILLTPWFVRFDVGFTKKFPIKGPMNVEFRVDILNLFDNINFDSFDSDTSPGSAADIFQITTAYSDMSNTYDPGGRIGQLMIRFNW